MNLVVDIGNSIFKCFLFSKGSILDSYKCFMGTELDILVCGNSILYKDKQNSELFLDYKNKYKLD